MAPKIRRGRSRSVWGKRILCFFSSFRAAPHIRQVSAFCATAVPQWGQCLWGLGSVLNLAPWRAGWMAKAGSRSAVRRELGQL